ncbi:MAG: M23 family metallopeptidase [Deltaproteobacteria bacterium]|nr:M23 family metallopeptidase [Deltaproteobacteria bacterium]
MNRAAEFAALFVWLSASLAFSAQPSKSGAQKTVEVFQGEVAEINLPAPGVIAAEGRLGNEKVYFYPGDNGVFAALLGADLEAKPGPAKILVSGTTHSGAPWATQITLTIKSKAFKSESFSVAQEFDQLSPEVLERIRREQEQFARVFAVSAPQRLWARPFVGPLPKEITSPFGYRRVINGTPRAPHTGVDLKAAMETPVLAANHGRVVLLGDFFYSGKSLVLDHGGGLFTVYFHLSEFKADEGVEVKKSDVIALSGMSGRVTGPHLHWGARMNGARIDPFQLIDKLGGRADGTASPVSKSEKAEK